MIFPAYLESLKEEPEPEWDIRTLESLGMIPNYYLQYFYYTAKKLEDQKKWPPSRAEEVMEIEKDLLCQYADPESHRASRGSDEARRRVLFHARYATDQLPSQRSRPSPRGQRSQQRRGQGLACGLGAGTALPKWTAAASIRFLLILYLPPASD